MKNYVYDGKTVSFAAGGTIASGDLDVISEIMGVAQNDAVSGETITYAIEGVFTLPKTTGTAWAIGDLVDFDSSAGECHVGLTPAAGDIAAMGVCTKVAASADATGEVKLTPGTGTKS